MRSTLIFNYLNLNHFKTFFYTYMFTDDTIIMQELIIIIQKLYHNYTAAYKTKQLIEYNYHYTVVIQYYHRNYKLI